MRTIATLRDRLPKLAAVAIAAVVVTAGFAPAAAQAKPGSPDKTAGVSRKVVQVKSQADLDKLSADQRKVTVATLVIETSLPANGGMSTLDTSGCMDPSSTIYGDNVFGNHIWRYVMTGHGCWTNYIFTTIGPNRVDGYVYQWARYAWSWDGVQTDTLSDYYGDQTMYLAKTQGTFSECNFGYCPTHSYPWIEMSLWADGTAYVEGWGY